MTTPLPTDLYNRAVSIAYFASPHVAQPAQVAARDQLRQAVAGDSVEAILDALHEIAREFRKGMDGHYIPDGVAYTSRCASMLAREIEGEAIAA